MQLTHAALPTVPSREAATNSGHLSVIPAAASPCLLSVRWTSMCDIHYLTRLAPAFPPPGTLPTAHFASAARRSAALLASTAARSAAFFASSAACTCVVVRQWCAQVLHT